MVFFLKKYPFSEVAQTNGSFSIFIKIWEKKSIFLKNPKKNSKFVCQKVLKFNYKKTNLQFFPI